MMLWLSVVPLARASASSAAVAIDMHAGSRITRPGGTAATTYRLPPTTHRLRGEVVDDGEVDELGGAVEHLGHGRPCGRKRLLAAWITLAGPGLLLAVEHDQGEDAAGVVLVAEGRRPHQARARLLRRLELLEQPGQVSLLPGLEAVADHLCPHGGLLGSEPATRPP